MVFAEASDKIAKTIALVVYILDDAEEVFINVEDGSNRQLRIVVRNDSI